MKTKHRHVWLTTVDGLLVTEGTESEFKRHN
jgi:hypothetical protein